MKRRHAIVIAVALIAFLVGVVLAHLLLAPQLARRAIIHAAERRGFAVDVGRATVFGSWFRFEDVVVCSTDCSEDDPLAVTIEFMKIKPDMGAALGGRARARSVDISGVHARVDLTRPEAMEQITDLMWGPATAGGEDSGEQVTARDRGSSGIPDVWADSIDVEVKILPGVEARFADVRTMPGDELNYPSIDLGNTTFSGFGMDLDARHVIVEFDPDSSDGLVRSVSLIGPHVRLDAPGTDRAAIPPSDDQAGGDAESGTSSGEIEGDESTSVATDAGASEPATDVTDAEDPLARLDGLLARVDEFVDPEVIPLEVLFLFPQPRVEFSGGKLTIGDAEDGIVMSRMRGHVGYEPETEKLVIVASGEMEQGPFSLDVTVDPEQIVVDADTPYLPASTIMMGRDPFADRVRLLDARLMVDGGVVLDRTSHALTFDGVAAATGITVESSRIALEPVTNVHFRLDGHVELDPRELTIVVTDSELDASGIPLDIPEASIARLEDGYRITARGNIRQSPCQELFNSLPLAMRSSLPGFHFTGLFGMEFDIRMDWEHPDDAVIDFDVDNQCRVVSGGSLKLEKYSSSFVHKVKDKVGEHEFVMGPGSGNWANLEEISPYMPHAIVTTEDGAFYKHHGISEFGIKRAAIKNLKKGYFAYGASTITMQLVKNLFLSRDKTISRKLQELIVTWWVENSMEKDQIIELYLNVVEYGPALYGIVAASDHYFGKTPADLDLLECAYLAKMLPNPVARYRFYKKGGIDEAWRGVLERVVTKMYNRGYITESEWEEAMASEFHFYYPGEDPIAEAGVVEVATEPAPILELWNPYDD